MGVNINICISPNAEALLDTTKHGTEHKDELKNG